MTILRFGERKVASQNFMVQKCQQKFDILMLVVTLSKYLLKLKIIIVFELIFRWCYETISFDIA